MVDFRRVENDYDSAVCYCLCCFPILADLNFIFVQARDIEMCRCIEVVGKRNFCVILISYRQEDVVSIALTKGQSSGNVLAISCQPYIGTRHGGCSGHCP